MHVAECLVYDGHFTAADLIKMIQDRLHLLPRYRQKIVSPPLGIAPPTWEDDPDFDVANHVDEGFLPAPGDDKVLSQIGGQLFVELLDRSRPLWKATVLQGHQSRRHDRLPQAAPRDGRRRLEHRPPRGAARHGAERSGAAWADQAVGAAPDARLRVPVRRRARQPGGGHGRARAQSGWGARPAWYPPAPRPAADGRANPRGDDADGVAPRAGDAVQPADLRCARVRLAGAAVR